MLAHVLWILMNTNWLITIRSVVLQVLIVTTFTNEIPHHTVYSLESEISSEFIHHQYNKGNKENQTEWEIRTSSVCQAETICFGYRPLISSLDCHYRRCNFSHFFGKEERVNVQWRHASCLTLLGYCCSCALCYWVTCLPMPSTSLC